MYKIKYFEYDVDITKEHCKVYGGSLDQMSNNFMLKAPSKVVSKHCMQCFFNHFKFYLQARFTSRIVQFNLAFNNTCILKMYLK